MIYLDNAATSFPKPRQVSKAVYNYMTRCGASYGRGGYASAAESMDILWQAREGAAEILGVENPQRVVFTKNATEALNIAIKGMLKPGAEVITSPLEHNSVIRPLTELGCNIRYLPLSGGVCDVSALSTMLEEKTDMVIITHASNVSGVINDVASAAEICRRKKVPLLIDCAQSAGSIRICGEKWGAMLAFAGHKGFMAPQGTGGLYIPEGLNPLPLMSGGTGSSSEKMTQPDIMPDKYESGTLNMAAISGFETACRYLKKAGTEEIHDHEIRLAQKIISGLMNIKGITVLCPEVKNRTSAVSFYFGNKDTSEAGNVLDAEYNIAIRCGLHCAPTAHRAYGTLQKGTLRVSPGWFNTKKDADKFLLAVSRIQEK